MSTRAFCFASVTVLLCLNLVCGWERFGRNLPYHRTHPKASRSWPGRINTVTGHARTFSGRSDNGEELMLDGDVILTMPQYRRLYDGMRARSAGRTAATPWTDGVIPYEALGNIFTREQKDSIKEAMQRWENETCVRFREAHGGDQNKMVFIQVDGKCYAGLGMQGGSQDCSLSDGCFYTGAVEHELGHTMGLIHEHQRENRDDYVKIDYFAIQKDMLFQINKYAKGADDKLGLPYDYHSIMHYSKTAFSATGKQTIFPRMMSKTDVIGRVFAPSFYDIKLINLMYNCKDRCRNPPYCQEPCFVNEKCQCYCEDDAPKERCQDKDEICAPDAAVGNCEANMGYMLDNCRKSCGLCKDDGTALQLPCIDLKGCSHYDCITDDAARCKKTCNLCGDNNIQPPCKDKRYDCKHRADIGECESNLDMMLKECRRSCDFCLDERLPPRQCEDEDTMCVFLETTGACNDYKWKMSQYCKRSCNNCNGQIVVPGYCRDMSPHCFYKAWIGECDIYGSVCMQSCNLC